MNMYFIKNFVKFLNIIKIVFFILVLSTSKLYAQSFEVALANAYSNHPLLFSERIEGKVVTEEVADALSGWEPKVYLDGSFLSAGSTSDFRTPQASHSIDSTKTLPKCGISITSSRNIAFLA